MTNKDTLDMTVDEVTFLVLNPQGKLTEVEYDVHGEAEAIDLINDCFSKGASITEQTDPEDPEDTLDVITYYPPHRICEAYYFKQKDTPAASQH